MEIGDIVLYKKIVARIAGVEKDKFTLETPLNKKDGTLDLKNCATIKVREKDFAPLGFKAKDLGALSDDKKDISKDILDQDLLDAHEIIFDSESKCESFHALCDLLGADTPALCYKTYIALMASPQFLLDEGALKKGLVTFCARSPAEIAALKEKEFIKAHEKDLYKDFLSRACAALKDPAKIDNLTPDDKKRLQVLEGSALGGALPQDFLKDLGVKPTAQDAHRALLRLKIWTPYRNPYPTRCGVTTADSPYPLPKPNQNGRVDAPSLAFAIDNADSTDPDDAVSFDGKYIWVHVADPSDSVIPGDPVDKSAMTRGSTVYLPEGAVKMLGVNAIDECALGLKSNSHWGDEPQSISPSPALSFRLLLNEDGGVLECKVQKTLVRVIRMTYDEAQEKKDLPELQMLFSVAEKRKKKREKNGAIDINLPEVDIKVVDNKVILKRESQNSAHEMVKEMMLLAGEGAAKFAFEKKIPFPFVTQSISPLPKECPAGLAGEWVKIHSMRPRTLSTTPASHDALGLSMYTQVTSPLRRYIDFIAHEQLTAFLRGGELIKEDLLFNRIAESDISISRVKKAQRNSEDHFRLLWLIENSPWEGDAVCLEIISIEAVLLIESLGMIVRVRNNNFTPDETVHLKLLSVDLPSLKTIFEVTKKL